MPRCIASIVEGHGEVEALPVLVRRILLAQEPPGSADILRPRRIAKGSLLRQGELERYVEIAASQIAEQGPSRIRCQSRPAGRQARPVLRQVLPRGCTSVPRRLGASTLIIRRSVVSLKLSYANGRRTTR
jgi:hypothetical protein